MMPQMDFFPQRPAVHPMIYAYRDLNPDYDGLLKVGYTEKDVDRRVAQQYPPSARTASSPMRSCTAVPPCGRMAPALPTTMYIVCSAAGKSPAWAVNGSAAR